MYASRSRLCHFWAALYSWCHGFFGDRTRKKRFLLLVLLFYQEANTNMHRQINGVPFTQGEGGKKKNSTGSEATTTRASRGQLPSFSLGKPRSPVLLHHPNPLNFAEKKWQVA
jgi:hypothetical protein